MSETFKTLIQCHLLTILSITDKQSKKNTVKTRVVDIVFFCNIYINIRRSKPEVVKLYYFSLKIL